MERGKGTFSRKGHSRRRRGWSFHGGCWPRADDDAPVRKLGNLFLLGSTRMARLRGWDNEGKNTKFMRAGFENPNGKGQSHWNG